LQYSSRNYFLYIHRCVGMPRAMNCFDRSVGSAFIANARY
jgi:hypothetical protein